LTQQQALNDTARTATLDFTNLDIANYVGERATAAIIQVRFCPTTVGTGDISYAAIKPVSAAEDYYTWIVSIPLAAATANAAVFGYFIVKLSPYGGVGSKVITYGITVGTGWTVDTRFYVMGYVE